MAEIELSTKIKTVSLADIQKAREQQLLEKPLQPTEMSMLNEDDVKVIQQQLDQPIDLQKHLTAKVKIYVDEIMAKDMKEKGYLTEQTRKWVETYNQQLDSLHKKSGGDTNIHLHLGKVTHAHISGLMTKYKNVTPRREKDGTNDQRDSRVIEGTIIEGESKD